MSALEDGAPGQDGGGGGSEAKAPVCAAPIPPSIKILTTILPAQGPYCLVWRKIINEKSKWIHEYSGDVPLMYLRAMDLKLKHDVYFATHAMSEAWAEEYKNSEGRPSSSREKKDMGEGRCLHIDVDVDPIKAVKAKAYNTRKEAVAALLHFIARNALPTPIVINSGGGLHVYWPFTRSLSPAAWLAFAERFNTLVRLCGFRVDPSRTTDIASILRMLDTLNHKNPGEPRRVSVKEPIGTATEVEELIAIVDRAIATFPQVEVAQALSGTSRRGEAQASNDAAKDPFTFDAEPMRDARRKLTPPAETAEYIAWVEAALIAIGPNLAYPEWRDTAFSVMATGWSHRDRHAFAADRGARLRSYAGARVGTGDRPPRRLPSCRRQAVTACRRRSGLAEPGASHSRRGCGARVASRRHRPAMTAIGATGSASPPAQRRSPRSPQAE